MIRTDNDIIYMTAGEACYILRVAEGRLLPLWLGARVEPEDELVELGGLPGGAELYTESCGKEPVQGAVLCDGEITELDLCVKNIDVGEKVADAALPTLRGGKTVTVTLCDDNTGLNAVLYYTPYPRGGFARRAELFNAGKHMLRLRAGCAVTVPGEPDRVELPVVNCAALLDRAKGEAFAFALLYGGSTVTGAVSDGYCTRFDCEPDTDISLAPGQSFALPEMLCVWSDRGVGGAARIFHDIFRENAGRQGAAGGRVPVTLCVPDAGELAVSKACELGADVLVLPFDGTDAKTLKTLTEECVERGVRPGLAFGATVATNSPLLKKAGFVRGSAIDLSVRGAASAVFDAISAAIKRYGAEYVSLSGFACDGRQGYDEYEYERGRYLLLRMLAKAFPELSIEGSPDCGSLCYCSLLNGDDCGVDGEAALPPCSLVLRVKKGGGSLKARFDLASLGCLGYSFDPAELSEDAARAIRAQILSFQDDAPTVAGGDMYRSAPGDPVCYMAVAKDKSRAYAVCRRDTAKDVCVRLRGVDAHALYHVRELDKTFSGAALSRCGIRIPRASEPGTYTFHLRQVADFE